jgi:hypothetical protein
MANNRDTRNVVKRTRNDLTLERKIEILDEWNRCGKVSTTTQRCGITRRHLYKLIKQEKKIRETVASSPSSSLRKRITSDIRHVNKRKPGQVLGGTDVSSSTKKTKIDTDQLLQIPDEEGSHIEVKPKVTELDTETDIRGKKFVISKLPEFYYSTRVNVISFLLLLKMIVLSTGVEKPQQNSDIKPEVFFPTFEVQ